MFTAISPLKILHYRERIENLIAGIMIPPATVSFDMSNYCTHHCVWCNSRAYQLRDKNVMKREIIEDVIDTMGKEIHGWKLGGGGEPLAHPEALDLMGLLSSTKKRILLTTNGSLLSVEHAKLVSKLRVSLDAVDKRTHERLHQSTDWDVIIANIKAAVEITKVGLGFLIHPSNFLEIIPFVRFAKELGVTSVQIRPAYTDYDEIRDTIGYDYFEWGKKKEEIIREIIDKAMELSDPPFGVWTTFYHIESERWKFDRCYALTLSPYIGPSGQVWICCGRRAKANSMIGTIGVDGTFEDIWFSKKHMNLIKNLPDKLCPFKCTSNGYNRAIHEAYIAETLDLDWI